MNSLEHTCIHIPNAAAVPPITSDTMRCVATLLVTRALDCPKTAANLLLIVPRLPLLVPLLCLLLFPLPHYLTAFHLHSATTCDAESACSEPRVVDRQQCRVRRRI